MVQAVELLIRSCHFDFLCRYIPISHFVFRKAVASDIAKKRRSTVGQAFRIYSHILKSEGVRGLYRGYLVSLCTYGSNSAFYWSFYYLYSELVEELMSKNTTSLREPLRIMLSGFLASTTAVILTNPFDVVRTRYQLQVGHFIIYI